MQRVLSLISSCQGNTDPLPSENKPAWTALQESPCSLLGGEGREVGRQMDKGCQGLDRQLLSSPG